MSDSKPPSPGHSGNDPQVPSKLSQRGKAVLHDSSSGYVLPVEFRNLPPQVTWRCARCSGRMLRLYLTPVGWILHGEHFRISMKQWADINGAASQPEYVTANATGFDPRAKRGKGAVLPLALDEWPLAARFEGGCKRCGETILELDELRQDAEKFRTTRRRVETLKAGSTE